MLVPKNFRTFASNIYLFNMALRYELDTSSITDLILDLKPGQSPNIDMMETRATHLPAEWYPQSGVQLTWPHADTDWCDILHEVDECYVRMALEIAMRERLLIVTPEPERVNALLQERLPKKALDNITLHQMPTNDTWARDHGFITLLTTTGPSLLDFQFNGWGKKFQADQDNLICRRMQSLASDHNSPTPILKGGYVDHLDFVLEGGSIESDGRGTILTTQECLLAPNRNQPLSQDEIEQRLKSAFNAERILWLCHGYLAGDDTDSHIDTLARLCPNDTIAYVQCLDKEDEHYEALHAMEQQLSEFRTIDGRPYKLVPLPMAAPEYDEDGQRLPATYANFLVVNGAVLMPTYRHPELDEQAKKQLQKAFPKHEIVGIDCRVLIEQHGSLHCCTMQFPMGVVK